MMSYSSPINSLLIEDTIDFFTQPKLHFGILRTEVYENSKGVLIINRDQKTPGTTCFYETLLKIVWFW